MFRVIATIAKCSKVKSRITMFQEVIKCKRNNRSNVHFFFIIYDIYVFATLCERAVARHGALDPSAIEDRRSMSGEYDAAHATSREINQRSE